MKKWTIFLSHQWERLQHIQEIQLELLAEMNKNDKDFSEFHVEHK